MVPIPDNRQQLPPLDLVLTFPTLESLSEPALYRQRIADAARTTSHLTLIVKFQFPFPSHSTPVYVAATSAANADEAAAGSAPLSPPPQGSSTVSSSSSSSSSAPHQHQASPQSSGSAFDLLEPFLSSLYSAATQVFIAEDRPLDDVEVVLEPMRALPFCSKGRKETLLVGGEEEQGGKGKSVCKDPIEGQYEVVALGGTFDHLHAGHKILLTLAAFLTKRRLIVGVTDTKLLGKKKLAQHLESIEHRMARVANFVELVRPGIEHDVVPIQDVYGPTAWETDVTALVVSDETRGGGDAVNAERTRNSLNELDIFVIKLMGQEGDINGSVETKMGSTGLRTWIEAKRSEKEKLASSAE